ncbi:MAG TPA: LPS export ABC transporter permease LptG [Desulfobacteraceae bacterium]|nr:LPS export ABC transporter permease LptG [Desulfobacteraceae bacterium]
MRILAKYFYREFFKFLILCLGTFMAMYLLADFFERIDNFIEANVQKTVMLSYFAYKTPYIIVQMLPPATLIAVIIMFSTMEKNNEITAMKASGIGIFQFSKPVIIASIFLAIGLFFFSEIIVPYTSSKSNEIWRVQVDKRDPGRFYGRDHIWYKGSDCIFWIRHFNSKKKVMLDPTFYFFDSSFKLSKKIQGRLGIWKDKKWIVKNGIILKACDDGDYIMSKFKKICLDLPETPDTFVQEERDPEEMSYWQIKQFAERVKHEGYDATKYFVDLNIKTSFPFIILVMVFIGIPIALWKKKGGTPVSIILGVALCFLYLVVLGVSRSLGLAGFLPPILSAWLANGVFLFLGIYLMANVDI